MKTFLAFVFAVALFASATGAQTTAAIDQDIMLNEAQTQAAIYLDETNPEDVRYQSLLRLVELEDAGFDSTLIPAMYAIGEQALQTALGS